MKYYSFTFLCASLYVDIYKSLISPHISEVQKVCGLNSLNDLKRWHEGFERKEQTSTISPGNTLKLEKDDPRFVWPIPQHELDAPGVDLAPNESNK